MATSVAENSLQVDNYSLLPNHGPSLPAHSGKMLDYFSIWLSGIRSLLGSTYEWNYFDTELSRSVWPTFYRNKLFRPIKGYLGQHDLLSFN